MNDDFIDLADSRNIFPHRLNGDKSMISDPTLYFLSLHMFLSRIFIQTIPSQAIEFHSPAEWCFWVTSKQQQNEP